MTYPSIDPVAIHIGPLQVRWYGLMYVIGFGLAYILLLRASRRPGCELAKRDVGDFLTYAIVGIIVGARLGYGLFYNLSYYAHNPAKMIAVWEGGMSFHGGLIGVAVATWLYAKKAGKSLPALGDLAALVAPLGLFFGRIGNFINGELYGRVSDLPWAMVFPGGGAQPRHPSQLYEAFFEGLVLFLLVLLVDRHARRPKGAVLAVFLVGYGVLRFSLEFFREPDPQLGFVLGPFTMGQVLCTIMVLVGIGVFRWCSRQRHREH